MFNNTCFIAHIWLGWPSTRLFESIGCRVQSPEPYCCRALYIVVLPVFVVSWFLLPEPLPCFHKIHLKLFTAPP